MTGSHLVLLSNHEALAWVIGEQRMAFPRRRARQAARIGEGDEVFLYSTRGCFGNPTRDRGRVIATARVTTPVRTLPEPVVFGERAFTEGCGLGIDGLAPFRDGLVLRDLVPELSVFPDPKTWSVRLRRSSLALPPTDAATLRTALHPHLQPYACTAPGYQWSPRRRPASD